MSSSLLRRLICGCAAAAMFVALALPWAQVEDADRVAWGLWKLTFPLCVAVAVCALATSVTGGRIGVNRPDVSLIGATDGLGVITTVTLAWLLFYDFPADAGRHPAVILAVISAAAAAFAAADYRPLRGAPWFPRLDDEGGRTHRSPSLSESR